jgi:hypothetical protein
LADGALDLLAIAFIVIGNQDLQGIVIHLSLLACGRTHGISTMRQ